MKRQQIPLKNSLLLLLTATIWGVAFVAQSVGMDYVGGFTFNMARSLIGSAGTPSCDLVYGQKQQQESGRDTGIRQQEGSALGRPGLWNPYVPGK